MLTIYGSDLSGPAIKVRLTASYLNVPYEWRLVNLREGEQKQEWFLKINPVGKIPAIDDDGFFLFESNACAKYIAAKNGGSIYPNDVKRRAVIDQWIDFVTMHVAAHVSAVTYNRVFAPRMNRPVNQQSIDEALKLLETMLPIVEKQLNLHANIAGDALTLADISLFSMLEPIEVAGISITAYPKLNAWRNGLKAQKFYTSCYTEYGAQLKK